LKILQNLIFNLLFNQFLFQFLFNSYSIIYFFKFNFIKYFHWKSNYFCFKSKRLKCIRTS